MAETIRIEIPVSVKDNTEPGLSKVLKGLKEMQDAAGRTNESVSRHDRTAQKTQQSLMNMVKQKYQVVLDVLDRVSPAAGRVYGSLRNIGGKVWNVTMKAKDLVTAPIRGVLNLLKNPAFQVGAVLGVSVGFKDTVDTFANFESAMSQVKAISGATGPEFEKLTAKAKQMGATTKFTATESAEAFNYMAMAGWKTNDMMNGIEGIMNLAAASGESLGTTSDIVTDALTAFGMKANEVGHFSDVLAQASSNSNTNVSLMGETFKYVGTMAGSLSYSIEDVALATGLMANVGLKGSMAGTSLNSIMTRLSTNAHGARDAIKELGVEFFNSDGSARKFSDVMRELREATANMTDEEKSSFANKVAGTNAQKGLLAILNASVEDYDKLSKAINNADGASKRMADTMLDNLQGAFTLLQSAADGVKLSLGERLKPYLMDLTTWLTDQMPNIEKGLMQFMDFVDEKVEAVKAKIAEFTATDEWQNADIFGKVHIAWDNLIAQPFGEWWDSTGREFFASKARSLGEGLGKGISSGLLALLGIDLGTAAEEGQSIGAAFAKGFVSGFDADAVTDALGKAMKGLFSNAAKILPGGEKADLSSWLSAAFLAKLITPLLGLGFNTAMLGRTIFGGGAGGLGLGKAIIGTTGNQMMRGTGLLSLLANAGYSLTGGAAGSAMSGGAAAAAGAAGITGGIVGGVTLISGGKDIYTAVKSNDEREKKVYTASGISKIGGVGAGAAIGSLIAPGLGTLVGAGLGGLVGWFAGNRETEAYRKEQEEAAKKAEETAEATRKLNLEKERSRYSSDIMKKAFDETNLSVDEFKESQEYAALMAQAVARNMKNHFGSVALSAEEIQSLAKRITLGRNEAAFEEFVKASELADTRVSELKDTMSDLNRLEWKAGFGFALTVQEQDDYRSKIEEYINNAKQYVEDKQYEFTTSISLLMDVSEGSKGAEILENSNEVYAGWKEQISTYGEQLQEVLGTALADGVISGKDKMTIKLDGVDVELPEDEAIAALQGRIQEITEKMSTAQQKSSMEALKIKYGSSQMDHASFQGFQQELIAQGEQAKKGYDDALNAGLTGLALQYPNGGAEYEAAKEELAKNYHENVNNWNNSAQDFQFDMLAENYAVAFETAFADMDLKGANVQEKIKEAMKNATADGVDVSAWDVDTASKYLGLDKLSEESAEAITLITSDIAETVQGKLSEAFAGGTAGTISEDGYHPMSLLAGLPENIAAELQNVDFSSAGITAVEAINTSISTYLAGGEGLEFTSYAAALDGNVQKAVEEANAGLEAGKLVPKNVNDGITSNTAAVEPGCQAVRTAADGYMSTAFGQPFNVTATLNITGSYNLVNPPNGGMFSTSLSAGLPKTGYTPGKRAAGGFTDGAELSWIGEDGPEVVIPLGAKRRQRGIDLWQQAGEMLGAARYANGGFVGRNLQKLNPLWIDGDEEEGGGRTSQDTGGDAGNWSAPEGIKIEVSLNPTFQVTAGADVADGGSTVELIKSHLREMADELAGEMADRLEGVFSNMPKGA